MITTPDPDSKTFLPRGERSNLQNFCLSGFIVLVVLVQKCTSKKYTRQHTYSARVVDRDEMP